jgi:AAA+ superfamily predicted ATPase
MNSDNTFEKQIAYPDFDYADRYNQLVGIDSYKEKLEKSLGVLLQPNSIRSWADTYAPKIDKALHYLESRPPLVILEGDVGCGKTELASTVGDAVSRNIDTPLTLLPLSLSSRGEGMVGQMTKLISSSFDFVIEEASNKRSLDGKASAGYIMLIDEADALAQSRENNQMHHEDKAGVNALLRGIDRIGSEKLPAAVIMCTNRLDSLDPALKRRAFLILKFDRPNDIQRETFLSPLLEELDFNKVEIAEFVKLTGPNKKRDYGFTYSDISQRLIPNLIIDAYPDKAVDFKTALLLLHTIQPTQPFKEQ